MPHPFADSTLSNHPTMNPPEIKNRSFPRLKGLFKATLIGCAIGLPLWVLCRHWSEVAAAIQRANPWWVGLVGMGLVVYTVLNASVWCDVLRALGWNGARLPATRVWVRSEAMKWLPGGIWGYASRVVRAPLIGVARPVAAASLVAELMLTIAAWAILAALGMVLDGRIIRRLVEAFAAGEGGITGGLLVPLVGLGLLLPCALAMLAPVRRAVLRRLEPLRIGSWRLRPLARALASYLGLCLFHAALLMLLVRAFHPAGFGFWPAAAADGGAWLIGFFAIGVPGGIGVREAGIAWFLGAHIPPAEAMAVAVLWRALQVAAELTALAASHASARLRCRAPRCGEARPLTPGIMR